jgi:branched-chain amino acid transport system substrate-binding protein
MRLKKQLLGFVFLLIGATVLSAEVSFAADSFKIGTVLAMSGRFAFLGDPERKGVELAVEEINAGGGVLGKSLEIVSYDDEGKPGKTAILADRLIKKDNVIGVVGASHTGTIHVAATACEKACVPQFYISGNSSLCKGKRWVFNAAPADELDAAGMVEFLRDNLKVKEVGIIHDANEYGTRSAEAHMRMMSEMAPKIQVVGIEKYQSSDRDMSAQLINLKNAGSECIVIWGVGFAPAVVVKNWSQLGMKHIHLMGGAGMGSYKMINTLGEAGEGLLFNTVLNYGDPNAKEKAFLAAYRKKFGVVPPTFAACGYDAAYLLVEAIKIANGNREKLAEAICEIKGFEGVQGTFSYSTNKCNGLEFGCYVMAMVKNKDYYPAHKVFVK